MPTVNIDSYGAVGDGVTDDSGAFAAFKAANAGTTPTTLVLTSGKTYFIGGGQGSPFDIVAGVTNLVVSGYGANLKGYQAEAPQAIFELGGQGVQNVSYPPPTGSARLDTVAAGSTTLVLKNLSDASQFSINTYALIAGFDVQGAPSGPPNSHFFEHVYITNISGTTITIQSPLANTYNDWWPVFDAAGQPPPDNGNDCGGPATLYTLDPTWNLVHEYQGFTIDQDFQTYARGRDVTYRDVTVLFADGAIPTQNGTWRLINCNLSACGLEFDKQIGEVIIDNTSIGGLVVSSSSINLITVRNGSSIGTFTGTPRNMTASDSTIGTLYVGTNSYGCTDGNVTLTNCTISNITDGGLLENYSNQGINVVATMANGVITIPQSAVGGTPGFYGSTCRWCVPGTVVMWVGHSVLEYGRAFRILDVRQSGSNALVYTDWPGGFPTNPNDGGKISVHPHPCTRFTARNCTGCADIVDLCQAPAGAPYFSYSKRTYDGSVQNPPIPPVFGKIVRMNFTVARAYTGPTSPMQMQFYSQHIILPDGSEATYNFPAINLTIAGTRTVRPSGVTGTQSGDSDLSLPNPDSWFPSLLSQLNTNISGQSSSLWPTVVVEVITDQDVGIADTAPLYVTRAICNDSAYIGYL